MEPIQSVNRVAMDIERRAVQPETQNGNFKEMSQGEEKEYLISDTDLERAVEEANEYIVGVNAVFNITTHEGTGRTIVQLVDMHSHETIKEFPPRELLDVVAGLWEQAGILVDRTE